MSPCKTERPDLAGSYLGPRTPVEELLVGIWEQVLGTQQVVNLCLQRSNRLKKIVPKHSRSADDWPELMRQTATTHRDAILAAVTGELRDMFDKIAPTIAQVAPRSFADLGCGQAFIDLFIHREFGCDLVLIDIETSADENHSLMQTPG